MHFLASYYNMTVHHYKLPHISQERDYMLEINPLYVETTEADKLNVIDARWIDTETGLFIDITTLRRDEPRILNGVEGALMVKDRHHYLVCHNYLAVQRVSATQQCLICTVGAGERDLPFARESLREHAGQGTICVHAGHPRRIWERRLDENDVRRVS